MPPVAEPRTWTIALPPGTPLLNANQRLHWAARGKRVKTIRNAAWALARQQQIPQLDRATVRVEYRPPDRRKRDASNLAPSAKAAIDGMTDAKVWADDDSRHVLSETYVIGPMTRWGQLLIHVTEVTEENAA